MKNERTVTGSDVSKVFQIASKEETKQRKRSTLKKTLDEPKQTDLSSLGGMGGTVSPWLRYLMG